MSSRDEPTILSTPKTAGTRADARRMTYEAGAQRTGYSSSGAIGGAAFGGLVVALTSNAQEEARKEAAGTKREAGAIGAAFTCQKDEGGAPTFCCVYCWDELANYGSKACGHVFGCAACIRMAAPRCPMCAVAPPASATPARPAPPSPCPLSLTPPPPARCRAETDQFVPAQVLYDLGKKVFTSGIEGAPTPPEVRVVFTDALDVADRAKELLRVFC